jgi:rhodanese-related sulfurtransferase
VVTILFSVERGQVVPFFHSLCHYDSFSVTEPIEILRELCYTMTALGWAGKTFLRQRAFYKMIHKEKQSMNSTYQVISPEQAKTIMEREPDCLILDVREEEEYITGHVYDAVPFTLSTISAETAEEEIPAKDTTLLVYCRSGKRSRQAAEKLADLGYTNVYDFGGLADWPYELSWS